MEISEKNRVLFNSLSSLYRSVVTIDWLSQSLATTIRAATQRMAESGMGGILFGRNERDFQKELASESFRYTIFQLSSLHRSALWEVCRVRAEPGFDERDLARNKSSNELSLVYQMRIVCQEGAICRNGIDIDGCDNIGNVEMGEIIEAYDRCINSSGVLRYKTNRGWVSELTRGHGRENIAEIVSVRKGTGPQINFAATKAQKNLKRIECGIPDLRSVSASVLVRLHRSHTDLFSSFERVLVSRLRTLNIRDPFQSKIPPYIVSVGSIMSKHLQKDFHFAEDKTPSAGSTDAELPNLSHDAAKCMYYGNILNLFHTCLYSEKRMERLDRRGSINIPLLLNMLTAEGWTDGLYPPQDTGDEEIAESSTPSYAFLSAIQFVLKHSIRDMAILAVKKKAFQEEEHAKSKSKDHSKNSKPVHHQRLSRVVASSLPPTIALMQRLISRQTFVESPISLSLGKLKPECLKTLIISDEANDPPSTKPSFKPHQFVRSFHLHLAKLSFDIFSDDRLCCAPAHVLHPWILYMNNVISSLEDAAKRSATPTLPTSFRERSAGSRARGGLPGSLMREGRLGEYSALLGMTERNNEPPEPFEPSEESIERLIEMGFSREHAIESLETVGSNRVEVAMEYALNNPPSSPATLERRRAGRAAREERRRQQLPSAPREAPAPPSAPSQQSESTVEEEQKEAEDAAKTNHSSDSPKEKEESKPKSMSEEELKAKKEEEYEEKDASKAKEYLESIKKEIPDVCLNILEAGSAAEKFENEMESVGNLDDGSGGGDSDTEDVTVVVASFLVDLCTRFKADLSDISVALIRRLKSNLRVKSRSHCQVKSGCEANFW